MSLRTLERLKTMRRLKKARRFATSAAASDAGNEDQYRSLFGVMPSLRADPSFTAIAARQGLVSIWQVSGHWPDFRDKRLG